MPHADTPLIQLEDVHFGYGERPVLEGVSLQVPKGKVTALMGASGGGKTTVLRLIGGQYRHRPRCAVPSPSPNGHVVSVWRAVHRHECV